MTIVYLKKYGILYGERKYAMKIGNIEVGWKGNEHQDATW